VSERRTTTGPAGELSYLVWDGPAVPSGTTPLVLLHPVNSAAAIWEATAALLAGERAIYAIDYRAHGSSAAGGPYLPVDYAADALAMMDSEGIGSAHVAGGSIGGAVSVELATLAPGRVVSIALFGAAVRIGVSDEQMADMAAGLRELGVAAWFAKHGGDIIGDLSAPGVVAELTELASTGRGFQLADSRAVTVALMQGGAIPALVVTGTQDPTCPPAMARELAGYFGTSAVLLDGIGHLPMIEAPQLTATLLRGHLSGS
jgi:3-oxoadipate enol-lactonase